jgi:purine-binding chemotaxis protein CheW
MMEDLITTDEEEFEDLQEGRFLTFALENEEFGVPIAFVNEIIGMQKINEVPEAASFVKGIINLRGQIISVIDMRLKFKKQPAEYDDRTCIIIVDFNDIKAGFIVDHVSEVINIENSEISPPPDFRTGFHSRFINGIGKVKDHVVLLLDCDKIFSEDELESIVAGTKNVDESVFD